tara:strand:- start:170 stop:550 length:381 start_codon:yes stop_codon:yes gene_type:complete
MELWLAQVVSGSGIFTISTVVVLVSFSLQLLRRIYQAERQRIDSAIKTQQMEMKSLNSSLLTLEGIIEQHGRGLALLTERDKRRTEEYSGLKERMDLLDNKLGGLNRDMNAGLSEIKTLIIQQGKH